MAIPARWTGSLLCDVLGTAAATKLVLNTALVTAITSVADTLAVARAVGIPRPTALDLLATGALGSGVTRLSAQGSSFSIALAAKDIALALALVDGRAAPVARAAASVLHEARDQSADLSAVAIKET